MSKDTLITAPADPRLEELCDQLAELSPQLEAPDDWPAHQLALCGRYGVYRWFVPRQYGGEEWSDAAIIESYLRLSAACLTTTFVITQRMGACRRIASSPHERLKRELLPGLASGERFATVAISHLTTSRQHVGQPILRAEETPDGLLLDGYSAWVTGAAHADVIVAGASLDDGRQVLVAVPTEQPGIEIGEPERLIGLSASHTGSVRLDRVTVSRDWVVAGPVDNVMQQGAGGRSGGLQTSTLALGLAAAAIEYLAGEAERRPDLAEVGQALQKEWQQVCDDLLQVAVGNAVCSNDELRVRANRLVLRATQSALATAKGAGYIVGHPAGRWCREALFFLVWSCPPPVLSAQLCEFAGIL